nr:probable nucleoredoxin 1 [Ipomoea batatas]
MAEQNGDAHDLRSILCSSDRDFLIRNTGDQVKVDDLKGKKIGIYFSTSWCADGKKVPVEGKTVGLYFSVATYGGCSNFTPKLREVYQELKEKNANFEIVMIPLDDDEESFKKAFESLPWFSVPLGDRSCEKLVRYFELSSLPTLVIIGPNGKTLQSNVAEAVEEHGALVYPFTPEKFAEVEEIEKAKKEKQTLESILVKGEADFVIGKDGVKIPVSDLVGKNILLYFSAHCDRDQSSFDEFFSKMPWLAIPFGDDRKGSLSRLFKVRGIPIKSLSEEQRIDRRSCASPFCSAIEDAFLSSPFRLLNWKFDYRSKNV